MLSKPFIMIGTDFSESSNLALKAAGEIARRCEGSLHILHVADYPYTGEWGGNDVSMDFFPHDLKNESLKHLNLEVERQMRRTGVQGTYQVSLGGRVRAFQDEVEKKKPDLLVLGFHGHGALEGLFHPGGLTTKMVTTSEVPVLVIKRPFEVKKVAGLIDAVEPMPKVFPWSEELAFVLSSELEFISLWQDISAQSNVPPMPITNTMNVNFTSDEKDEILKNMRELITRHMDARSRAEVKVRITGEKKLSHALIKMLEEEQVDLAVMGRHQRNLVEKIFLGSTTRRVMESFRGNILVLPPEATE